MAQGENVTVEYTSKAVIRSWFETNDYPSQSQFWAFMESYWHKGEQIPADKISGLDIILSNYSLGYKIWSGNISLKFTRITKPPLILEQYYVILDRDYVAGDDFTNCGFVNFNVPFRATATNATVWAGNTPVIMVEIHISTHKNTFPEGELQLTYNFQEEQMELSSMEPIDYSTFWVNQKSKFIDNNTLSLESIEIENIDEINGLSDGNIFLNSFEFRKSI